MLCLSFRAPELNFNRFLSDFNYVFWLFLTNKQHQSSHTTIPLHIFSCPVLLSLFVLWPMC